MSLTGSTSINKALDEDTFQALATAIASRLGSAGSEAWPGEQKFNSVPDEFTVDTLTAHFKAAFGDTLPTTNVPAAADKVNATIDVQTLAHVCKYLRDVAGISITVPSNSVAPVIAGSGSGPFNVSSNGTWSNSPDTYSYQWQGDSVDLPGETSDTLAQDNAYVGVSITCDVTATNEAGDSAIATSNAIVGA